MKKSKLRRIIREEIQKLNEITKKGSAWRNTSWKWLYELLKKQNIKASKNRFISFSLNKDSGGQDDFGKTKIEFVYNFLLKQGAIEIWYEADFFKMYPDICIYVTGYKNEKSYYEDKGYDEIPSKEEIWKEHELDWDTYVEDFSNEEEIVIKKLKYVDKLIKHVKFNKKPNKKLLELLDKYSINYTF